MPSIPAFCRTCNIMFPSGIRLGPNAYNVTLQGCKNVCPQCRNIGEIPDGTYRVVNGLIHLLSDSSQTIDKLRKLSNVLEQVMGTTNEPQSAAEKIKEKAPELSSIINAIPKTLPMWGLWILLICELIRTLIAMGTELNRPPSIEEIQKVFEETIEGSYRADPNIQELKPPQEHSGPKKLEPYRAPPNPAFNAPCPCGSGKEYKNCCWI